MSRYHPVKTDDGLEIRDSDGNVISTSDSWPPRDSKTLERLFEDANIDSQTTDLFLLLLGALDVDDERGQ